MYRQIYTCAGTSNPKREKLRRTSSISRRHRVSKITRAPSPESNPRIPQVTLQDRMKSLMEMDLERRTRESYSTAVTHGVAAQRSKESQSTRRLLVDSGRIFIYQTRLIVQIHCGRQVLP